jgi:hypothetical protein
LLSQPRGQPSAIKSRFCACRRETSLCALSPVGREP